MGGKLGEEVEGDAESLAQGDEGLAGRDIGSALVGRDLLLLDADSLGKPLLGPAALQAKLSDALPERRFRT